MKYLLALLIIVFPFQALAAEKAYCFGDNKCYGEDYKIKYICFLDNTCLGADNVLVQKGTWEPISYVNPTTGLVATKDEPANIDPAPFNYETNVFNPDPNTVSVCPSNMKQVGIGRTYYDFPGYTIIKFKDGSLCKLIK